MLQVRNAAGQAGEIKKTNPFPVWGVLDGVTAKWDKESPVGLSNRGKKIHIISVMFEK